MSYERKFVNLGQFGFSFGYEFAFQFILGGFASGDLPRFSAFFRKFEYGFHHLLTSPQISAHLSISSRVLSSVAHHKISCVPTL